MRWLCGRCGSAGTWYADAGGQRAIVWYGLWRRVRGYANSRQPWCQPIKHEARGSSEVVGIYSSHRESGSFWTPIGVTTEPGVLGQDRIHAAGPAGKKAMASISIFAFSNRPATCTAVLVGGSFGKNSPRMRENTA